MKNTFLSFLAVLAVIFLISPGSSLGASQKSFEMTVSKTKIGDGEDLYTQGSHAMKMRGDTVYSTWVDEDATGKKIMFEMSYDGGYTWERSEIVSYLAGYNGYPSLAVGPHPDFLSDPNQQVVHIVWSDYNDFYYSRSVNGGAWSTPYHLNGAISGDSWGASVEADPLGGVHVAWQTYMNYANHIYYSGSHDGGANWDSPVDVDPSGAYAASIGATPDGSPYIAYECNSRSNVCFSKGAFNGSSWTFSTPVVVSGPYRVDETSIAVKDASTIHIAWRDYTSGSTDGGLTWSPNPAPIDDWEPSLAIDSSGVISAAWGMGRGIYFSKSSDGGVTWDKVITVDPDGQYPSMTLDAAGKPLIMWYDRYSGVIYFTRD